MTASPIPPPRFVAYDPSTGAPLVGGYVWTYLPGTTVTKMTWQDQGQTTVNPNPAVLDAAGSMPMWGVGDYELIVTDALGNNIPSYSGRTTAGLSGNVVIDGTLGVTGNTYLSELLVSGSVAISNPSATTTIGGILAVIGTSDLTNVNVAGTLSVPGSSLLGSVTAATLGVVGPANFDGVNVASGILFGPSGSIGSVAGVGGTVAVNCSLNVGANITVAGVVSASGTGPGSGTGAWLGADGVHAGGPTWGAPLCFNGANAAAATGFFTLSDARTKTDIRDIPLEVALEKVRLARPRSFKDTHGMPTAGFVAQEDLATGRNEAVTAYHDPDKRFADDTTFSGLRLARKSDPDIAYMMKVLQSVLERLEALERK